MNKPLLILFLIVGSFAFGQNLVPNPSFEEYDTCPTGISNPGDYQINHCLEWTAPTLATSDYFNSCATFGVNVPNSAFGYQNAYEGVGMLGILMSLDSGEVSYVEYVQAKLTQPLEYGKSYEFTFRVNLANGSDYAVGSVGAWFTNTAVTSSSGTVIFSSLPNIQNNSNILSDTLNWMEIKGEFNATGGEEYVTIGYYTDTLAPDTLRNNPQAVPVSIYSYYYIDGLELKEVVLDGIIPNVITPNADNINDAFELPFAYTKVTILNRWGNLVWKNSGTQLWNGKSQDGRDVSDGVYFYVIETESKTYKGFVQVVR